MEFSPVHLSGGSNVFVKNVVQRFREVQQLCAREDQGPRDRYQNDDNVELLENGRRVERYSLAPHTETTYTVDHNNQQPEQGQRVIEQFRYTVDKGLTYGRHESIDGLTTGGTEWTIQPDGILKTSVGHGQRLQSSGLGQSGLENAILVGFPLDSGIS